MISSDRRRFDSDKGGAGELSKKARLTRLAKGKWIGLFSVKEEDQVDRRFLQKKVLFEGCGLRSQAFSAIRLWEEETW